MIKPELALTYDDVLLRPGKSLDSRSLADPATYIGKHKLQVPIISANMSSVTEIDMALSMWKAGGLGILHRFMSVDEQVKQCRIMDSFSRTEGYSGLIYGVSVGVNENDRIDRLISETEAQIFCVDLANGFSDPCARVVERLKHSPRLTVIAGNVSTREGAQFLFSAGADVVKCGCGPGANCTTRIVTGCGSPQLTAVMETSEVGPIIADGGIRAGGDCVKSLAGGAVAVMVGSLLAGCQECPGKININTSTGKQTKTYAGMASSFARSTYDGEWSEHTTVEGVSREVEVRGSVVPVIDSLAKSIRSGMSYLGARNLSELRDNAEFVQITSAGYLESIPHGLR